MWRCCNLGFHNDADDNGMEVVMRRTAMKINLTELLRLKHITGFSKLFKDVEYGKAWQSSDQVRVKMKRKKAGEEVANV